MASSRPARPRWGLRAAATGAALACAALALQLAAYIALETRPPAPRTGQVFDLVAVFGGTDDRVRSGLAWCRLGGGRAFVLSDAGPDELEDFFNAYGRPGHARVIPEPYARTTDENARLSGRIARREGFRNVLLVTSWYHIPRSYLLLRLELAGSGIRVATLSAEAPPRGFLRERIFWLEYLKFWGSLARWAKSCLRGHGLYPGERPLPVD